MLGANMLPYLLAGHGQQNLQISVSSCLYISPKYLHVNMALNQQPFFEELWGANVFIMQDIIRDASLPI